MNRVMLNTTKFCAPRIFGARAMSGGGGEGKAGAIREAGGAFGRLEAAREEEYFLRLQRTQLENIEKAVKDNVPKVEYHKKQIAEHEAALKRHKEELAKLH